MKSASAAALLAALLVLGVSACTPAAPAEITVSPREGIYDPVDIQLSGLPAGREVSIESTAVIESVRFESQASFVVSDAGTLDLARDVPISGDWDSADSMAPLWALTSSTPRSYGMWDDAHTVNIAVSDSEGKVIVETDIERPGNAPDVVTQPVRTEQVAGIYAKPTTLEGGEKRPAVLVFSGSEGGLGYATATARWLAGLGYPALAIAYFDHPGLPQDLRDVPVETFENGLHWLREQPEVELSRVFSYGVSRGGEMALWLAAEHPDLVYGAFAPTGAGVVVCSIGGPRIAAWSRNGQPLTENCETKPTASDDRQTQIDVAGISGPVVLACGTEDALWNACAAVDDIAERRAQNTQAETLITRQDGASHYISNPPFIPEYYEGALIEQRTATRAAQLSFWNDVVTVLSGESTG